ncbi:hypothetical protein JM93_03545 [Roseibium hamelinense]|uniref:YHS domain-containing protein n=1 Tax=Roseibium hamelinense TaxID=150831 RepID=A0A562SLK7_9HYPH|nr:twin-arginine translocation pathway signal protein [Roseibium hamelinense]TWI82201.1 hypothetical protein JM93_03545 [Roseibium hamelinense]
MFTTALLGVISTAGARPTIFVPDPIAGYAIGGHDPVAYFVDHKPRKGMSQFEFSWGGADWVFVNQGNLAAFKQAPEVYAPLYAGCGGYALSEGYATAGNPFIFALVEDRLVFFHSVVNRFLFLANYEQHLERADENAPKTGCIPSK